MAIRTFAGQAGRVDVISAWGDKMRGFSQREMKNEGASQSRVRHIAPLPRNTLFGSTCPNGSNSKPINGALTWGQFLYQLEYLIFGIPSIYQSNSRCNEFSEAGGADPA